MDANTYVHFVQILPGLLKGGTAAGNSLAPAHRMAGLVLAWSATPCNFDELADA
jgi:hypothetical protein